MKTNKIDPEYLQALGNMMHRMKGIRYWELIRDMSSAELVILHALGNTQTGSMQVGELTESLSMHPTSVSRLMNSLEKKGYVERSLHEGNRRITDVSLTEQGKKKSDDNNRILNDYWMTVLAGLEKGNLKKLVLVSEELVDRMEEVYLDMKSEMK
ncbi:MAG: MarR family transcriptional regulator [Lachnospiraceae bacterium]|nr:MarR family transcriptional regulator [Lachnospiraceae bacterium]